MIKVNEEVVIPEEKRETVKPKVQSIVSKPDLREWLSTKPLKDKGESMAKLREKRKISVSSGEDDTKTGNRVNSEVFLPDIRDWLN